MNVGGRTGPGAAQGRAGVGTPGAHRTVAFSSQPPAAAVPIAERSRVPSRLAPAPSSLVYAPPLLHCPPDARPCFADWEASLAMPSQKRECAVVGAATTSAPSQPKPLGMCPPRPPFTGPLFCWGAPAPLVSCIWVTLVHGAPPVPDVPLGSHRLCLYPGARFPPFPPFPRPPPPFPCRRRPAPRPLHPPPAAPTSAPT